MWPGSVSASLPICCQTDLAVASSDFVAVRVRYLTVVSWSAGSSSSKLSSWQYSTNVAALGG